ncbi:MAG: LLM class flavin-dependent oxidoreductase [Chloroflexia bacterium]|nr:LLM class flavin-dependent oxidoreductase [Chloroflexia bacterium]
MALPLSFLDLTQIESGSTSSVALRNATGLAQAAERLGYTRYWFAEHHNSIGLASGSPEIMVAHVANHTGTIRVGTGGVMLPNHAPLKIAEVFRVLEALHPGRIDLGLGRAPGTDTLTAFALRRSEEAMTSDLYPALLAELLALDKRTFPAGHPFAPINVTPADVELPPIWLLGSSEFSGQFSANAGLGFSFAAHINRPLAIPVMRSYREQFEPSTHRETPHSILAVSVIVGDTPEQVEELRHIVNIGYSKLIAGEPYQMPTHTQARETTLSPIALERLKQRPSSAIYGDAKAVTDQVREFAADCQADEVMITTSLPNQEDRLRVVTQIAEEWGLESGK